jgi:peptidoglycan/LPS O-acetylase OafA/YrhL
VDRLEIIAQFEVVYYCSTLPLFSLNLELGFNMKDDTWPPRLYLLDISRGIASLGVVLYHWQHFYLIGSALPQNFSRQDQPAYGILKVFYDYGDMGVEYFFLLSGFIFFWLYKVAISSRKIDGKQFFLQRFSRLYPLHFITLLFVTALQTYYVSREGSPFVYPFNDLYHFILNLGFASAWGLQKGGSFNGPVWSVSVEVLVYAAFFLVAFFRQGGLIFTLSVSIASYILVHALGDHGVFLGMAMFFLGGTVFHLSYLVSTKYFLFKYPVYFLAISAWLIVFMNSYIFSESSAVLNLGIAGKLLLPGYFWGYIIFPLTISSLAIFEIDRKVNVKSIAWLGDITYSSYLLHFPLQLSFAMLVSFGILNPGFQNDPKYLVIFFAILIPLSYVTNRKIERPLQNIIRNRYSVRNKN